MEIRPAGGRDWPGVARVCRETHPRGDYVEDTWAAWLAGGGLRVITDGGECVGVFNVTVRGGQGWVEGLRVRPGSRRRGAGAAALGYCERHVRARGGRVVRSLVGEGNAASAALAAGAGWSDAGGWGWYAVEGAASGGAPRVRRCRRPRGAMYADSWRMYELDGRAGAVSVGGAEAAVAPSAHFPGTVLATVLSGGGSPGLASYLRSLRDRLGARPAGAPPARGWRPGLHVLGALGPGLPRGAFRRLASYRLMAKALRPPLGVAPQAPGILA